MSTKLRLPTPGSLARRLLLMAAALLLSTGAPACAQGTRTSRDPALAARNQELLRAAARRSPADAARFFPRRGTWDWVRLSADGRRDVLIRRFRAAETPRAINLGGPACELFDGPRGRVGPLSGASLAIQANMHGFDWPAARPRRFVSPETEEAPKVFVEWKREGAAWVVSRIGVRDHWTPPAPRPGRNLVVDGGAGRDTASTQRWYTRPETIEFRTGRYDQYGLERPLESPTRVGSLDGVGVYAEAGAGRSPEVLYVGAGRGQYQPYRRVEGPTCHFVDPAAAGR